MKRYTLFIFIILAFTILNISIVNASIEYGRNYKRVCENNQCLITTFGTNIYEKNSNGNWTSFENILKISKFEDDIIFDYKSFDEHYNITFEAGVIYNNTYYSFSEIKSRFPQINFEFPVIEQEGLTKYSVNISNIPINLQPNVQFITLTYKNHNGANLSQLKTNRKDLFFKNFKLSFDDLLNNGFQYNITFNEKRIYIYNISGHFIDNYLYLDPAVSFVSNGTTWNKTHVNIINWYNTSYIEDNNWSSVTADVYLIKSGTQNNVGSCSYNYGLCTGNNYYEGFREGDTWCQVENAVQGCTSAPLLASKLFTKNVNADCYSGTVKNEWINQVTGWASTGCIYAYQDCSGSLSVNCNWNKIENNWYNGNNTAYFRKKFNMDGIAQNIHLYLQVEQNGLCYVNNILVRNFSNSTTYLQWNYDINITSYLQNGDNLIACQVNSNSTSYVAYFDAQINGTYLQDISPPIISNQSIFTNYSRNQNISITTDEISTCKWSFSDTNYSEQNFTMTTTNNFTHYFNYSLFNINYNNTFSINCKDSLGYVNNIIDNYDSYYYLYNYIPNITSLTISPSPANQSNNLTLINTTTDLDNDNISYSIIWYKDGIQQTHLNNKSFVGSSNNSANTYWVASMQVWDDYNQSQYFNTSELILGDDVSPVFYEDLLSASSGTNNAPFTIYIRVNESSNLQYVKVEVMNPNSLTTNYTMSNTTTNQFSKIYTPDIDGVYTFIFYTIDSSGNKAEYVSNLTYTDSTSVTPSPGGGGGGGAPIVSTPIDFSIQPEMQAIVMRLESSRTGEFKIINNEPKDINVSIKISSESSNELKNNLFFGDTTANEVRGLTITSAKGLTSNEKYIRYTIKDLKNIPLGSYNIILNIESGGNIKTYKIIVTIKDSVFAEFNDFLEKEIFGFTTGDLNCKLQFNQTQQCDETQRFSFTMKYLILIILIILSIYLIYKLIK